MEEIKYAFVADANGKLEPGFQDTECTLIGKVIYKIIKC